MHVVYVGVGCAEMFSGKKKNYYVAPMVGAEVYQRKLEHYIKLFGSAGKA